MNKLTRSNLIVSISTIVALIAMIVGVSFINTPQVATAESVASGRNITLYTGTAATAASTTTAGVLVLYYGEADCYSSVTVMSPITTTGATTVTNKLQHSPNNVIWVDLTSWASGNITTNVLFTHTTLYGQYIRLVQTVGNSFNPVTNSVVCTIKNVER